MLLKSTMTGSPWHVEKMVREEGDAKRHKSRRIYYRITCLKYIH